MVLIYVDWYHFALLRAKRVEKFHGQEIDFGKLLRFIHPGVMRPLSL